MQVRRTAEHEVDGAADGLIERRAAQLVVSSGAEDVARRAGGGLGRQAEPARACFDRAAHRRQGQAPRAERSQAGREPPRMARSELRDMDGMRVTVDVLGSTMPDAVQTGPAEEAVGAGWPFAEGSGVREADLDAWDSGRTLTVQPRKPSLSSRLLARERRRCGAVQTRRVQPVDVVVKRLLQLDQTHILRVQRSPSGRWPLTPRQHRYAAEAVGVCDERRRRVAPLALPLRGAISRRIAGCRIDHRVRPCDHALDRGRLPRPAPRARPGDRGCGDRNRYRRTRTSGRRTRRRAGRPSPRGRQVIA